MDRQNGFVTHLAILTPGYKAAMENIVALVMTSRQAAALSRLIRMQAAAYAEADGGEARPDEVFTPEDLETVLPLLEHVYERAI